MTRGGQSSQATTALPPERNGLGKGNLTKRPARRRQMAGRPPDCARGLPNLWVSRGANVPELRIETLAA
jgi:hypothetical protein